MEFLIALLIGLLVYLIAYNLLYRSQLRLTEAEKRVNAAFDTEAILREANPKSPEYNLAVSAVNMADDKFLGIGLNNFGVKVNKPWPYSKHLDKGDKKFKEGLVETVYLMIAAETGWLNLVVFAVFLLYYYIMNFINIFRFVNTEYQYFAVGLAGGLGSIYLQSSLEWVLKQAPNYYQLMFCFAIIAAMKTIYQREFAVERRKEAKERDLRKQMENTLSEEEMRQVETAAANAARSQ